MTSFIQLFIEKRFEVLDLFVEHMYMTNLAVILSLIIGIPVGISLVKNKYYANIVIAVANLMQSIPCIALLAFLLPFAGIGKVPAIIMVVVYALLPIIKNTYTGISSIDPKIIESAKGIGLSQWQILTKVQIPMSSAFIMAGIRISAVTAVGSMTIAAFAGAGGLGWFIATGMTTLNTNLVLLGAIPASMLALFIDFILAKLEGVVTPEGLKTPELIRFIPRNKIMFRRAAVVSLCMLLAFGPMAVNAVEKSSQSSKTVTIGSTNFTEALILGYIYSYLIEENSDIEVEEKFSLNGSSFAFSALQNGNIDMFVEYTGTALANMLNQPIDNDPDRVYSTVKTLMSEKHNIETSAPLGFNNTYVMSVTRETAEKYGLETLSDLLKISDKLRLGCTVEFTQREDCLPGLEKKFGTEFKSVSGLDASIRYKAIEAGEVDVIDAFSTDALLEKMQLITLTDDIGFFPPFYAVNFIRDGVFDEYPELKTLLGKLDNFITEETMRKLNYRADVLEIPAKQVAEEFLTECGLI